MLATLMTTNEGLSDTGTPKRYPRGWSTCSGARQGVEEASANAEVRGLTSHSSPLAHTPTFLPTTDAAQ